MSQFFKDATGKGIGIEYGSTRSGPIFRMDDDVEYAIAVEIAHGGGTVAVLALDGYIVGNHAVALSAVGIGDDDLVHRVARCQL